MKGRATATRGSALLLAVVLAACSGGASPGGTPIQQPSASAEPTTLFRDLPQSFAPSTLVPSPSAAADATVPPVLKPSDDPDATPMPAGQELIATAMSVPAKGHADAPIAFEGSERGAISVMVDDDQVTASFAKRQLERSGSGPLSGLGTDILTSPRDGVLRISNAGPLPVKVGVFVWIISSRHLVVRTVLFAPAGAAFLVDVSLTEARPGDAPTAQLVDPSGARSPIDLAPDGPGRWTATVHPAMAGTHQILASVGGQRPRVGSARIDIGAEGAGITRDLAESTVDTDGDGLIDTLVLAPTVTVGKAGNYRLVAKLVDGTGAVIDNTGTDASLAPGTPTAMPIEFGGTTIHASGRSGPYHLVDLILFDDSIARAATLDDAGPTAAYAIDDFEP